MIGEGGAERGVERQLNEWLGHLPNELAVDAVGMWQIVAKLRRFDTLTLEAMTDWAKRGIRILLEAGAIAVTANRKGWLEAPQYGDNPIDISNAIVAQWLASGRDPPIYDSVWFALPERVQADHG